VQAEYQLLLQRRERVNEAFDHGSLAYPWAVALIPNS
jgi:hypothetical protein